MASSLLILESKMYGGGLIPFASVCPHIWLSILLLKATYRENPQDVPEQVTSALSKRVQLESAYKHRRRQFAGLIGLAPQSRGQRMKGIHEIFYPKLQEEYPPHGKDIYEADAVRKIWENYRRTKPLPDKRGNWKKYHKLDPGRLQHIVGENESIIIRDSDSKEIVCMVVRNFSNNEGNILEWINGVIKANTKVRKSIRVSLFLKFHFYLPPNHSFSLRILGSCARLVILVVPAMTANWDGQETC